MGHVNKVSHVFTLGHVAEMLGEDEEWLFEVAEEMDTEDGQLWVVGVGEDGVMAFTDDGIENLKNLIAIHKDDPSIIEKRRQALAAMMKPKTEESDESLTVNWTDQRACGLPRSSQVYLTADIAACARAAKPLAVVQMLGFVGEIVGLPGPEMPRPGRQVELTHPPPLDGADKTPSPPTARVADCGEGNFVVDVAPLGPPIGDGAAHPHPTIRAVAGRHLEGDGESAVY